MPGHNGSSLILPTQPVAVELRRALPDGTGIAIAFPAFADPRTCDQRDIAVNGLLVNELLVGLAQAQATIATLANRLAALEVLAAESARPTVQRFPDGVAYPIEPGARHRDEAKLALALAAVQSIADKIEITASPVLAPDDTVGAPASALDLLGVEDGPAPAGVSGPTDDGN